MSSACRPSPRVRVAHVVLQLRPGGMEKMLAEFARHADRERFDLRFVCLGDHGPVADEIAAAGWPVDCLGQPKGVKPEAVGRLVRRFLRWRTDVVHTHNNTPLIYAAPAARLAGGVPVVHTRHGQVGRASRRHRAAFRLATLMTRRVVCVSEELLRQSVADGVSGRKLSVIWNGVDINRFPYTGPAPGGPAVVVGRLAPGKGVDDLLRALVIVTRVRPDFRLEVVGDGPCRPHLEQLAIGLGVADRVCFRGHVTDIPAVLGRAGLFVLASHAEGLPLTVLEAMARGLPVVATRVGGVPEAVADGLTGRLVPPADPADLAAALIQTWLAPDQAKAMGLAGRRRVERQFDIRRTVAGYEAEYLRLVRRHSRAGPPADSVYAVARSA